MDKELSNILREDGIGVSPAARGELVGRRSNHACHHIGIAGEGDITRTPHVLLERDLLAFVLALEGDVPLVAEEVREDAINDVGGVLVLIDHDPVVCGRHVINFN